MKKRIKYAIATLLGASALTMGSAHAFGGHHGDNGMGFGGCHKHRFWNNDDCSTQMKEKMDEFKEKLEITEGQEPAWQRFIEVLTTETEKKQKQMEAMKASRDDNEIAPEQMMDFRISMMESRLESMKVISQAYKDLAAVLTDEQKQLVEDKMSQRRWWRH
jgi:hypothetical protein